MRNLVGVLAIVLIILLIAPGTTQAGKNVDLKRYAIELQLGGSFYAMQDVNDYIPDPGFANPLTQGTDEKSINIGTQLGVGFSLRAEEHFGYEFGYNLMATGIPPVLTQEYRMNAYFPEGLGAESWVEQRVSGWELYITPTWYWDWGTKEIGFSIGPAIYRANLDRSISIVRSASGSNPAGSFDDASGTALGFYGSLGLELPISEKYYLNIKLGGRYGNVPELTYEDNQGVEQKVWMNSASNSTLAVDFSGVFLKFSVKSYFFPSAAWRTVK